MRYEAEIREALINNSIRKIAEGGFEKATTKELINCDTSGQPFKLNEAYIYRLFGSKENLFAASFITLDKEFSEALLSKLESSNFSTEGIKETLYDFFLTIWEFVLKNEERCRSYVRFLYSIYFNGHVAELHRRIWTPVYAEISRLFKDEANVVAILHSVFITLLDFAIRVYNGDLADDDDSRPNIFNILFQMMQTYFKDSVRIKIGEVIA